MIALTQCRCGTLTCWLDSVQHRLHWTRIFSQRMCDRHEDWITR